MKRVIALVLVVATLFAAVGCTSMSTAEKSWVQDKANRSAAYVKLMDTKQTTAEQDQAWIHSQDASWQLWAEKIGIGAAAPSFIAGGDK